MSEQKQPDIRSLLQPRRKDDKRGILDAILNSDKNNPTKSRIPNAAGMSVFQMLGMWGSTQKKLVYEVQGEKKLFARNVEGAHDLFKRLYDENAISGPGGESRKEYVTASLGYFLQDIEDIERTKEMRLGESGGAARSK